MFVRPNGVELFYGQSGQGAPVILLHGNGETHEIFNELSVRLCKGYTVYTIDSRGHGRSGKVKALDYEAMMQDVAGFIRELGLQKPALYGFSDGGIIGLLLAARYPDMLSKLIISGANTNPKELNKSFILLVRALYFFTRDTKYKLMLTQPNITKQQLSRISVPTLVLAGEKDIINEKYTRQLAASIAGSSLKILSGESHDSYVTNSAKLYEIIAPFLG